MGNEFFSAISSSIETPQIKKDKEISCEKCGLDGKKYPIKGMGNKGILIINKTYDSTCNVLKNILPEFNISFKRDCWYIGSCLCQVDNPKPIQYKACKKNILAIIDKLKPKCIITLGKDSLTSIIGHKLSGRLLGLSMTDWVGTIIPDMEYKCFIAPMWEDVDFSYIYDGITRDKDSTMPFVIKKQIKQILVKLSEECVDFDLLTKCKIITTETKAISILKKIIQSKKIVAFDYETTGKKPYRSGHEIVSVSIATDEFSYAFPFFISDEFRMCWKTIMKSKTIQKIMHNKKFEMLWTKEILGYYPVNTVDTMINAHSLNNRKKVNLKFLSYINFGIVYEESIDKYLQSTKEEEDKYGANAFNQIKKANINELLSYNALDSLLTYKLYFMQGEKIIPHIQKGIDFFNSATSELVKMENYGVHFITNKAEDEYKNMQLEMIKLEKEVLTDTKMKLWDKESIFRMSAPGDISYLLFQKMNCKVKKENITPTGKPKSDINTLETYDFPIVKNVLAWRRLKKASDTYLKGFIREATNDVIHCSINLTGVDTFRSSSSDPNLQNVPARDKEIMEKIRKNIVPRKGNKLVEYDYRAMEACIITCYNKDPKLIKYVSDINLDVHLDISSKILLKKRCDVSKYERTILKSKFVFATLYGSYWKNTAKGSWDEFSAETKEHLKSKGISNLIEFTEHVKKVENWFWHDQFPIAYNWMKNTIAEYSHRGYIDLYTGFRCYGPMTKNQIINYRVQGTASHCKLWTLMQVSKAIRKQKMKSRIILEIHDSIIIDLDPSEEKEIDHLIWYYGTQKIKAEWDWLIIPLFIEKKISKVNGNWAAMDTIGILEE